MVDNATNVSSVATTAPSSVAAAAEEDYLKHKIFVLQLFLLLGYGIMFVLSMLLIGYMRYNRHVAFRGDASAARKIILPAFEPLLWLLAAATGSYTIFLATAMATVLYTTEISKLATEFFYSGRQFVFLIVIIFIMQQSVSIPALKRTFIITLVLSTYTIPVVWYMNSHGTKEDFYWVQTIARGLLLLLYAYVFIRPPGRASKRALREFCCFTFIYYAMLFAYNELLHEGNVNAGFNVLYASLLWGSLCPLVIWRVLKADTEYWRGMGQRACALQSLFRQKHHIDERISSQGLHVLIEMHRKYIVDFAYLELKQRIGVGSSAIVLKGILHNKTPVAVKVYTPSDFTEDTVAEFSHEAALCGALHHPNIVKFYGMCVSPPTICLVSELCQGSLDDITYAVVQSGPSMRRQQLLINLGYMLDAARAVAYIHSFSPPFLHRDIKPANFLVDVNNTVKLTDFGESRSLPRMQQGDAIVMNSGAQLQKSSLGGGIGLGAPVADASHLERGADGPTMTVKGTVDYMAPEVIRGKAGMAAYGEAADVYSLAITMWDILNPRTEKFPVIRNNFLQVFEFVIEGKRPPLDPNLHTSLREVIESAWQSDPRLRPSAQDLVHVLESIQEEVSAVFAMQLYDDLESDMITIKHPNFAAQTFIADRAIDCMRALQYVDTVSEGVRLGNALMDAGHVHHCKHSQPFDCSHSVFYFDEENIRLCQPIAILGGEPKGAGDTSEDVDSDGENDESGGGGSSALRSGRQRRRRGRGGPRSQAALNDDAQTDRSDSMSSRSIQPLLENGICNCRKLGQRLEEPRTQRRKFRRKIVKKAARDDNVLTAHLLHEDTHTDEFEGFESTAAEMTPV
ncbi:TPA: hypothetical protein N0F65_005253 [Lagenidium giganteum]|uniref:Protein kinase domain-containing protein n=1 Tax=Lagenidium giganteum TaxID=4803 RepID=A0AAV2YXR4_9STRA|nr:TPA: hypothetical protein N0F65_005253 [Lagenidium giganteum]